MIIVVVVVASAPSILLSAVRSAGEQCTMGGDP